MSWSVLIVSLAGLFDNKRLERFCSGFYFGFNGFSCFRERHFGIFKVFFLGGERIGLVTWEKRFFEVILGRDKVIEINTKTSYQRV